MKIALVHKAQFPVRGYGGTERVVWWLAKGLHELGCDVTLVCRRGSYCPFAKVHFSEDLPGADILHFFETPFREPVHPYVVTIEGNGKRGETFLKNTIFVSKNHAMRHGSTSFVYNGLDPDEYLFAEAKSGYLIFLAKASWKVKNVKGAISLARRSRTPLHILGGKKFLGNHRDGIRWEGMLDGKRKAALIAKASGLLFPVIWNEPFGIAIIEALVSGTPVLASPYGSLPELVPDEVGKICATEEDFFVGIEKLPRFKPKVCRDWVLENFHYRKMAQKYMDSYQRVLSGESLNAHVPKAIEDPERLYSIAPRTG